VRGSGAAEQRATVWWTLRDSSARARRTVPRAIESSTCPSRIDREDLQWHIAARPSDVAKLPEGKAKTRLQEHERRKASVRAKVEHPFRVIKRQFGLAKVRFRGLVKNTAHVVTLFALSNLWMARRHLMAWAAVRPRSG
jgi:IS5 family transposase